MTPRAQRALDRQLEYQKLKLRVPVERLMAYGAKRAAEVRAEIERVRPLAGTRLLEVGSGVHGNVFFLGVEGAIGIDPLADEYKKLFPAIQERARTRAAYGESLPFADASFDVVISDNVIDHAETPARIVDEMVRVLAPGGLLFFTVHVHHRVYGVVSALHGAWTRAGLPFEIGAFADHTVHFRPDEARALARRPELRVLSESVTGATHHGRGLPGLIKRAFYKNALYQALAERS